MHLQSLLTVQLRGFRGSSGPSQPTTNTLPPLPSCVRRSLACTPVSEWPSAARAVYCVPAVGTRCAVFETPSNASEELLLWLLSEGRGGMDSADGRRCGASPSWAVFSGSPSVGACAAAVAAGSLSSASRVRSRALSWSRSTCAFTALNRCLDCRKDCIFAYRGLILCLPIDRFGRLGGFAASSVVKLTWHQLPMWLRRGFIWLETALFQRRFRSGEQ